MESKKCQKIQDFKMKFAKLDHAMFPTFRNLSVKHNTLRIEEGNVCWNELLFQLGNFSSFRQAYPFLDSLNQN